MSLNVPEKALAAARRRQDLRQTFGLAKASRASQAVATVPLAEMAASMNNSPVVSLGPGVPVGPIFPQDEPRIYDYPVGYNLATTPRTYERLTFGQLQGLADSYGVARLAIEKRKDGIRKLRWSIRPKALPNLKRTESKARAARLEDAVAQVTGFLSTPDQEHQWSAWLVRLLEDLFVIDAPAIWLRPTRGGDLYGLEVIHGATIAPKLDVYGRVPLPPEPAYVQVIKGTNREFMTRDELIYSPFWASNRSPYGSPPLEWVVLTVNRALRREALDLTRFTDGNIDAAFLKLAPDTPSAQIKEVKTFLDELIAGNDVAKVRVIPIAGGPGTGLEKLNPEVTNDGERWLMHLTCAAIGVAPSEIGFVEPGSGLGGKGFTELQKDTSIQRDLSLANHLKDILDRVIATDAPFGLGQPELEFYWDDLDKPEDRVAEAQALAIYVDMAATTPDWIAENVLDQDPQGVGAIIRNGATVQTLEQFLKPPEPVPAIFGGPGPGAPPAGPGGPPPETPSQQPGEDTTQGGMGPMAKAAGEDLARWERKALKALKDGRGPARFDSAAIGAGQAGFLRDALAKASTVEGVRAAFDLVKAGGSAGPLVAPSSETNSAPSSQRGSSARDDRWWSTWR